MSYELARQKMVEQQVRAWDVSRPSVLAVLGEVAREQFVPAPCKDVAYADTEIPLPHQQVMLRPIIEGRLLQALSLGSGDRVLEIGTGSGYLTACLAKMCSAVTSIDIYQDFVDTAARRLAAAGTANVTLACMDAMDELPAGEFDAIAVTGSVPGIDERFIQALKPGGRLFIVVGAAPVMNALLITREADGARQQHLFQTDIPPLVHVAAEAVFSF